MAVKTESAKPRTEFRIRRIIQDLGVNNVQQPNTSTLQYNVFGLAGFLRLGPEDHVLNI